MLVKSRIQWIDLAKFVGILAMVWGHCGVNRQADTVIHAFHMPIFFFLSGYLFREKSGMFKKAKSLLIPYFAFSIVIFCFWNGLEHLFTMPAGHREYSFTVFIEGLLGENTIVSPYACIQWFLTCLFIIEAMFWFMKKLCRKDWLIALVVGLITVFGFCYPYITQKRLFWGLDTAFVALSFYAIGYFVKVYQHRLSKLLFQTRWRFAVWGLILAIALFATYKNGYTNMRTMEYGNPVLYYASALGITALIIGACKGISSVKRIGKSGLYQWILHIGQNTLIILCINQVIIKLLQLWVLPYILPAVAGYEHWFYFAESFVVLGLCLPIIAIVNQWLPFMYKRK